MHFCCVYQALASVVIGSNPIVLFICLLYAFTPLFIHSDHVAYLCPERLAKQVLLTWFAANVTKLANGQVVYLHTQLTVIQSHLCEEPTA